MPLDLNKGPEAANRNEVNSGNISVEDDEMTFKLSNTDDCRSFASRNTIEGTIKNELAKSYIKSISFEAPCNNTITASIDAAAQVSERDSNLKCTCIETEPSQKASSAHEITPTSNRQE